MFYRVVEAYSKSKTFYINCITLIYLSPCLCISQLLFSSSLRQNPLTLMAYSAQSTSKCQKLSFKEDEKIGVDRISNLPECLLIEILSFLTTEQSVQTSILSNRWKPLWTYVPKIDLDSERFRASLPPGLRLCSIRFKHIVSRVLSLHKSPYLRAFRLKYLYCYDHIVLDKWVSTVTALKLEELDLEISGEYWKLPPTIFSCKTLVVLKLANQIHLNPPSSSSFEFPSLKILRLERIEDTCHNSFMKLLSACPVLEDLSLINLFPIWNFKIYVPTLKRLWLVFDEAEYGDYEFEIDTPALEYFNFEGDLWDIIFLVQLDNLVEAIVNICSMDDYEFLEELHELEMDRIFNILAGLNHAKFFSFNYNDVEVSSLFLFSYKHCYQVISSITNVFILFQHPCLIILPPPPQLYNTEFCLFTFYRFVGKSNEGCAWLESW